MPATKTFSVPVDAKIIWQDVGIPVDPFSLPRIAIYYRGGQWSADPRYGLYDANGDQRSDPNTQSAQGSYALPGHRMGALVARIGTAHPFFVGDSLTDYQPSSGGSLYLTINDDITGSFGRGYADNVGSINVEVILTYP